MKRFIIVLSCLSILYAGAVWALEGCTDFDVMGHVTGHSEPASDPGQGSHHSHHDRSEIHCPNVLSEFLISSRPSLSSDTGRMHHAVQEIAKVSTLLQSIVAAVGDGPPGLVHSRSFPRHLLFSVIRV